MRQCADALAHSHARAGAAAGQLIAAAHTPATSYHGIAQAAAFAKWGAASLLISAWEWFFNNPACSGFRAFPTFGERRRRGAAARSGWGARARTEDRAFGPVFWTLPLQGSTQSAEGRAGSLLTHGYGIM